MSNFQAPYLATGSFDHKTSRCLAFYLASGLAPNIAPNIKGIFGGNFGSKTSSHPTSHLTRRPQNIGRCIEGGFLAKLALQLPGTCTPTFTPRLACCDMTRKVCKHVQHYER